MTPIKVVNRVSNTTLVWEAYRKAVNRIYGAYLPKRGPRGGQLAERCSEFRQVCRARGKSDLEMMRESIRYYSPDFCVKNFQRKWPPFAYAVSRPCCNRLRKTARRISVKEDVSSIVGFFLQFTKEDALTLITEGALDGESPSVQKEVIRCLES